MSLARQSVSPVPLSRPISLSSCGKRNGSCTPKRKSPPVSRRPLSPSRLTFSPPAARLPFLSSRPSASERRDLFQILRLRFAPLKMTAWGYAPASRVGRESALRCPKKAAGFRFSLLFSTAAEKPGRLLLPLAAAPRFSHIAPPSLAHVPRPLPAPRPCHCEPVTDVTGAAIRLSRPALLDTIIEKTAAKVSQMRYTIINYPAKGACP